MSTYRAVYLPITLDMVKHFKGITDHFLMNVINCWNPPSRLCRIGLHVQCNTNKNHKFPAAVDGGPVHWHSIDSTNVQSADSQAPNSNLAVQWDCTRTELSGGSAAMYHNLDVLRFESNLNNKLTTFYGMLLIYPDKRYEKYD